MSQAIEIVKRELDSSSSPPPVPPPRALPLAQPLQHGSAASYAGAVEIGLGYEQFGRVRRGAAGFAPESSSKKLSPALAPAPSPSPQFLQVPGYALDHQAASRGAFGSLATQDFLQPLERGANGNVAAKLVSPVPNGDMPLQLSSRTDRNEPVVLDPSAKESCSSRMQLQMQYGYMDHPHPLFQKNGLEVSHQPSRHWQQGNAASTKRPRSAQSEGDDNESEERKIHRSGDAISREVNSRGIDVKSNASRSKHSATEQRRRSKINDRFQMLRDLLPSGDQKRDKASFLLEVIEYVQALQERVKKFEAVEKVRYQQERFKPMPWDVKSSFQNANMKESSDGSKDKCGLLDDGKSRTAIGVAAAAAQGSRSAGRQICQAPIRPAVSASPSASTCVPAAEDLDASTTGEMSPELEKKQQQDQNEIVVRNGTVEAATTSQPQHEPGEDKDCLRENQLPVKQGLISLSSAYSQGLLEALTSALQNSGLDLSKAHISVQIELGKPSQGKKA